MTITDWQDNPEKCKRLLLRQIRDSLAMSTHPCKDTSTDTNCPCTGICAYKQHFDEFERVKAMDAQLLADEQILLLQENIGEPEQASGD